MKKFWTVRPNAGYGVGTKNTRHNSPDLPDPVGQRGFTMPGDLRVAGGAHNHLVHGSVLLPSTEAVGDESHYHHLIPKHSGGIHQIYVGDGASHNHTGELQTDQNDGDYVQPKYYLLLVTCDETEYANLTSHGVDNYAERAASQNKQRDWSFAPLSTTAWGAAKRNAIESRLHNALGLALPSVVDDDKAFIRWLLDLGGWRPENEAKHS